MLCYQRVEFSDVVESRWIRVGEFEQAEMRKLEAAMDAKAAAAAAAVLY